jgi:hypothetical protein
MIDNDSPDAGQNRADWKHELDPEIEEKRDERGEGNLSQITAEQNAGTIERVYQTADGEERTERVPAADSSIVPSEANTPIVEVDGA